MTPPPESYAQRMHMRMVRVVFVLFAAFAFWLLSSTGDLVPGGVLVHVVVAIFAGFMVTGLLMGDGPRH